ncbi:MAG: DNA-directed RNA polymerase subunit alpha [Deltaproteobacteria bacterium]|nr:DNA-directed RNA polymerase subunit alpha [Deltaproteobacteria bacterium]
MKRISLKDLIHPKRIEVDEGTEDGRYGKFVAEPLERGFGITIGNALRRVLLSSLQGAAVTAINIEGVMHEFSTIPGVVEDVTEIVLNLKEVVVRLEDKEEARVRIEAQGPGEVTAGMITGDPSVEVLNPQFHIASLGDGASLKMDLTIKVGRGYVAADKNRVEGAPMGTIFLDSIFSPIRRVNHVVTNARVGQRTDYDKLIMEIWTNGSIDPRSAVAQAAHILADQLAIFVGENLIMEEEAPRQEEPKKKFNENLFRRIDEIELSVRSANCLENADIKYIGELVQKTEAEMLRTKNFGRKSLNEIKELLGEMGLSLGMKLEDFPSRKDLEQIREHPDH